MYEIDCLVYAETAEAARDLSQRLEATGRMGIVSEVHEPAEFLSFAKAGSYDVVVVALGEKADLAFEAVDSLPHPRPVTVFLGPADRSDFILHAMRLGAREYLPPHADRDTLDSLMERVGQVLDRSETRVAPAPIIGVVGAKGGVGTSLVACQLSAVLQQAGHATCLLDLNLRRGDIALYLDLTPHFSLAEVARSKKRIDTSFLDSLLAVHRSGLSMVAAPSRPEEGELVRAEHVAKSLRLLRSRFRCLVLDLPSPWDEPGLRALDMLDALLVVTTPDLASLAHARSQLELLDRIGVPSENISVVANRVGARGAIREADAADYLGRGYDFALPNDHVAVTSCINSGRTLPSVARRSALTAAVSQLGGHLVETLGLESEASRALSRSRRLSLGGTFRSLAARTADQLRRLRRARPAEPEAAALAAPEAEPELAPAEDAAVVQALVRSV